MKGGVLILGDQRTALPGEINHAWVDRYTIGHFAVGTLAGLGRVPWWATIGGAVLWELVERPLKNHLPRWFPFSTQDTIGNAIVDILAVTAGWGLIKLLPAAPAPTTPTEA